MIRNATTRENVEQYCEEVLSGDVVACEIVIKAIEKYRREWDRIGKHDFPFTFDEQKADRAIAFFPMLLRHSVGEWAGQPFELSPWQQFIVWNIFGWIKKDDTRRFRKLFLSVARKNGKSTFAAGLAILMAVGDGEAGAQIFVGASKFDQAKIIFDEADRMVGQSPYIAKHARRMKNNLSFESSNSFIRPLGSDKPFDGLNPSAVFFDEVHSYKEFHRGFVDTMSTGSGARLQPLQVAITTAGNEQSLIYHEMANYCRGVILGDIPDHTVFGMIYELDKDDRPFSNDFQIETMVKANPGYGISVKPEYIEQELLEAKNKPQAKTKFMRYQGNRCVSSVEEVMSADIWDRCSGELSDWMKSDGIAAGVDLGGRDDLASYALVARFVIPQENEPEDSIPVYRIEVKTKSFISEDSPRNLNEEPFRTWIEDGKLIKCEYVTSTLKQHLLEDCAKYGIQYVAYDPYTAAPFAEELSQQGLEAIKTPQNMAHFTDPVIEYLEKVRDGRFKPDINDVVLRWAALNMCLRRDGDKCQPDKKHSKEKIDPAVAMLMGIKAVHLSVQPCDGPMVF